MPISNVRLGDGKVVSGPVVKIDEQTDKWSEIKLEDGTVLRVKPNVVSVIRLEGQYDADGNPMYAVSSNIVLTVSSVLPHMKQGAGTGKAN